MNERALIKRTYKENPPPAGIFKITNRVNGKILIGKGMNVRGILNSQQAQLKWGSHRNQALQGDWNRYGADQFAFEIADYLEPTNDAGKDLRADLDALLQLWLAKLEPHGEKGYNSMPVKR
jgi:hypothetical protein